MASFSGDPELVDPEDIAFEADEVAIPVSLQQAPPQPMPRRPEQAFRPQATVAQAAPMPDPRLSADLAEDLLAPATNAAVRNTFSRLNGMAPVGSGQTLEDMMRDMLRPMLKDWLDENLPSVVERMVEKEIARISRGVK
jgi:cell pole-organizing protein PopZ